jgi:hypothetical protein
MKEAFALCRATLQFTAGVLPTTARILCPSEDTSFISTELCSPREHNIHVLRAKQGNKTC